MKILKLGEDDTYNTSDSLSSILRWITWFITSIKSITYNEDLTETVENSLKKLTDCFGLKNSNKKLKTRL